MGLPVICIHRGAPFSLPKRLLSPPVGLGLEASAFFTVRTAPGAAASQFYVVEERDPDPLL